VLLTGNRRWRFFGVVAASRRSALGRSQDKAHGLCSASWTGPADWSGTAFASECESSGLPMAILLSVILERPLLQLLRFVNLFA
jgi:hypothetical protein